MKKQDFGTEKNTGKKIVKYILENKKGMKAEVINYGAILTNLWVPDGRGDLADIVLGYDTLDEYYENTPFFGATVGPNANRIGGACFDIDGKIFRVPQNEGSNNLHSDMIQGYHARVFEAEEGDTSVRFFIKDEDGNMGFPGNKIFSVTYRLTEEGELILHYEVTSDKKTIINPTNHSYFNLNGQGNGTIENHFLWLKASAYTPSDSALIPTGEIVPVKGTPMNFMERKRVGKDINEDTIQLKQAGGFDHNWVLDDWDGQLQLVAEVTAEGTDRCMQVYTTLPGIQFYAGNMIGSKKGKADKIYGNRDGMCLETQYFPDAIHKKNFQTPIFGPEKKYVSTTVYRFGINK